MTRGKKGSKLPYIHSHVKEGGEKSRLKWLTIKPKIVDTQKNLAVIRNFTQTKTVVLNQIIRCEALKIQK